MIGNYSTLLIGDSTIAGLSRYFNIWKRYFKPLYAINCGIGGDSVENILWRCKNLPSCPNFQNAVIMCGTNNIQHSWDGRNCTLIKAHIPSDRFFLSAVFSLVIVTGQSIEFI